MYCCHLLKSFISICALNDSVVEVTIISTRSCDLVKNLAFPCFIKELRIDTKYISTHCSCIGTKRNLSAYQHDRRQTTHKHRPLCINCTSFRIVKWYLWTQTTTFIDCYRRGLPGNYLPDPLLPKYSYLRITGLLADSELTHAAGLY